MVPDKLEWARALGATDVVDASASDPVAAVRELTGGRGVDVAIEAVGRADCVSQAVEMLAFAGHRRRRRRPPGAERGRAGVGRSPRAAYPNKVRILITDGGDPIPDEDFPEMAGWYLDGRLDLDTMVTCEASLDAASIDEAFRAMLAGEVIRTVVVIDETSAGAR